ncbi:Hint domain-containing protein [Silicimonas algicola]|uniref:Hint domain-containing protein n=1 Tax=Silicimonas algicola TaxID=1826607 RepID=A0A316G891_9RHOB|nr:Hint domain-containing protein [Silicimonas algicola]AZQ67494.1 Hint domain-containing protein [Silicimonas algicola]PWK57189.1 Hint domain-containing protein [Silicimonas algicola]
MRTASPCFTPGTLIATECGARPVEELSRGDRVVTRDNGLKRIAWVGRRDVGYRDIREQPDLRPVLVRKDAFGEGCPNRDMLVSPHHRFLAGPDLGPAMASPDEVLIAASDLVWRAGVGEANVLGVSYLHILCSRHEVILADGVWTETFHPDDQIFGVMAEQQRQEILELFPEVATIGAARRFTSARPVSRSRFEA